jgi:hypothetical protein
MGMYTEIVISTNLVDNPETIKILKYMIGQTEEQPKELPDHPLFKTERWPIMLRCSSYYHVPRNISLLELDDINKEWSFIVRSDFKNYQDEVNKFFDWIKPYLAPFTEMVGYSRYEESREPTIHYGDK